MTSLVKAEFIVQAPLVLAFLIVAVLAYRAKRTIALLLLMLASICYFVPRFTPILIALFGYLCGWTTTPKGLYTWSHSWWPLIAEVFAFLFLAFIIGALVFLIRERKEIATPHA